MKALILLPALVGTMSLFAQNDKQETETTYNAHYNKSTYIALSVNTYGFGLEVGTFLNNKLALRGGFDILPVDIGNHSLDFRDELKEIEYVFGYIPKYRAKWKLNFLNAHALVDYYPFNKKFFYLTGGLFFGSNKLKLDGFLADKNNNPAKLLPGYEWPVAEYEGHTFDLRNGNLDFEFKIKNTVKPYLGVGLGEFAFSKRFGFKFETGIIYQGDFVILHNGEELSYKKTIIEKFDKAGDFKTWLKWWPMVNFQFMYKF